MKVAVTGASGFVGSWLCTALAASGHEVHATRLRTPDDRLELAGTGAVIHLAALVHRRAASPAGFQQANVELTRSVGSAAAAAGARMVFVSTVKVHGEETTHALTESSPLAPADDYARSKAQAEAALSSIPGLQYVVLRPPLVYGPHVKANFLALMRAIARGIPLPLAAIRNRRSLVYVGNLADAIVRCIADPRAAGRTYLVSDGAPVSTPALCRALGAALGRPARLFPFPTRFVPGPLGRSLEADDRALRTELGWRAPFSVEEALRATADWYRSR
jgi:nucleoside-diphosphate-sugar epimerase